MVDKNSSQIGSCLGAIRHLALDLDGTVYQDGKLFNFTLPFLEQIKSLGIGHTFLTNNSSRSARDYVAHLNRIGIEASSWQVYTSGMATIEYLQANYSADLRLYLLGTDSLRAEFRDAGYTVLKKDSADEPDDAPHAVPDAVIVGYDNQLTYKHLCNAAYWIKQGKPFIATHPDKVCPTQQPTVLVDCGSICACLENASGRTADIVLGKPHPAMLTGIISKHQLQPRQLAMVGDRLYTDISMAHASGTVGVLVLTGEATAEDAKSFSDPPDIVIKDLAELGDLLCQANDSMSSA